MQCPQCHVDLVMSTRNDIEIDYCPRCRGVWLDRGELDKIIERASNGSRAERQYEEPRHERHEDYDRRRHYDDDDNYHHGGHHGQGKHHKKESFLGDLFDF